MSDIRTNLTEEEVTINMVELAGYLANHDNFNRIDVTLKDLHMTFEAYTVDESEDE